HKAEFRTRGDQMKKLALGIVGLAALFAAPAIAADMPLKAPPPVRIFSWTGCYVGGYAGGLWVDKEWFVHEPNDPLFGRSDGSHDPTGFIAGVQGGCDYQFAGGFVIGVAGDYGWTD